MTSASEYHKVVLEWEDCVIHHYGGKNGNNGVLLRYEKSPHDTCLFFIDGATIGVAVDTPFDTVTERVTLIFKSFLNVRNNAFTRGQEIGAANARYKIRQALGVML
jgi:hypothetical protein